MCEKAGLDLDDVLNMGDEINDSVMMSLARHQVGRQMGLVVALDVRSW